MGTIEAIEFTSFSEIEDRFQQEFEALHAQIKQKKMKPKLLYVQVHEKNFLLAEKN